MQEKNSKTKILLGLFLATAFIIYADDDEPVENEIVGERLVDDNGYEYTLIDNGDGTETAQYDNGNSVTFRRQEDGSLDYISGTAGLIAGLAAGYYLFRNSSNNGLNTARPPYTANEREDKKSVGGGGYIPSSNSNSTAKTPAASSAKSGFGGAGVRVPAAS